jgi:hypothetical protein
VTSQLGGFVGPWRWISGPALREVVGIALQFEGRPATDGKAMTEESLERHDDLPPAQRSINFRKRFLIYVAR